MVEFFLGYFITSFVAFNLMSLFSNLLILFLILLDSIAYCFIDLILNIKHDKIRQRDVSLVILG